VEGFDESSEDNAPAKGMGAAMMAERAYKAGSTFSISSESGGGTRVVVEVAR
jgi:signal transduction histidine kinase